MEREWEHAGLPAEAGAARFSPKPKMLSRVFFVNKGEQDGGRDTGRRGGSLPRASIGFVLNLHFYELLTQGVGQKLSYPSEFSNYFVPAGKGT